MKTPFSGALLWKRFLLLSLFSINAFATNEDKVEAQRTFAYSDDKQCYINQLPILPLIVYTQNENRKLFDAAVNAVFERQCDVDEADPRTGLNALHMAILSHDRDLVALLLEKGANPDLKIQAPNEIFHLMNSVEFTNFTIANTSDDAPKFKLIYEEILHLIRNAKKTEI